MCVCILKFTTQYLFSSRTLILFSCMCKVEPLVASPLSPCPTFESLYPAIKWERDWQRGIESEQKEKQILEVNSFPELRKENHSIMVALWEHQLGVALHAFHVKYARVSRLNKYNLPTKTRWWKSKILYALTDNSSTVHLDIIKLLFRILHIRIIRANIAIDWHWDVRWWHLINLPPSK